MYSARITLVCLLLLTSVGWAQRELLVNGDFAEGGKGWTFSHTWYQKPKGSGLSKAEVVHKAGRNGSTCVRLEGKNNRGLIMQQLRTWPDRFRISGWVKCENLGAAEAGILVEWMEGGKARKYIAGKSTNRVRGTTDWTKVEATFETPNNARRFHVDLLTTAGNSGTVWFDDISLVDLTEDTTPPPPVKFSAVAPEGDTLCVKLTWQPPAEDVLFYYVFVEPKPFTDTSGLIPAAQAADTTGRIVRGLPNGVPVHVGVVAVDFDGNSGEMTESVKVTPADREPPRPVEATIVPVRTGSADRRAALVRWEPYLLDEDVISVSIAAGDTGLIKDATERQVLVRGIPRNVDRLRIMAKDANGNVGPAAEAALPELEIQTPTGAGALSGKVLAHPGPSGLPGVSVRLLSRGGEVTRTTSRDDGVFGFAELPVEPLQVVAERKGFLSSAREWVLPGVAPVGLALMLAPLETRPYTAWIAPPVAQVFQDEEPPAEREYGVGLTSARNEAESFQIVVRPTRDVPDVSLSFSALVSADRRHIIQPENMSYHFVKYCHIEKNSKATPADELVRQAPADYPDELGDETTMDLEPGRTQPIYVLVHTPEDAAPGIYHGKAYVRTAHGDAPFEITLRVLPFAMPATPRLHVVVWNSAGRVRQALGLPTGTADDERVLRMLMRYTRGHHQTVWRMSWYGVPVYQWRDGTLKADWRAFDRRFQTAMELGVGQRICFNHIGGRGPGGWTAPTFVLRNKTAFDRHTGQRRQIDIEKWLPLLQEHLIEKGWLDRCAQHVADEPIDLNVGAWREQSRRVYAAAPKLRRIDAIHVVDLRGDLEVFVPQLNYFNQSRDKFLEYQRNGEAEMWFYTAWVPQGKFPNRMIDSAAIKPRVLHWLNYLYDTKGYLHWALNAWHIKLGHFSPGDEWITWQSAKRGLNSSIRYEAMRDGLEDCEYLGLLEDAQRRVAEKLGVRGFDATRRGKEIAHQAVRGCTDYVRTHHELNAVRVKIAEEIIAAEQSPLLLTTPEPRATTAVEPGVVRITGWVERGAHVRVNGQDMPVRAGTFSATVAVTEATNTVVVEAKKDGRAKRVVHAYRVKDPLLRQASTAMACARDAGTDVASVQAALNAYRTAKAGEVERLRRALHAALAMLVKNEMLLRTERLRQRPASVPRDAALREIDRLAASGRSDLARQLASVAQNCRSNARPKNVCRLEPIVRFGRVGYRLANSRVAATLWLEGARIIDLEIDGVPLLYHKDVETKVIGEAWFDIGGYEDASESLLVSALRPWQLTVVEDTPGRVAVRCTYTQFAGFGNITLTRVVDLRKGEERLGLRYTIANDGARAVNYVWRAHAELAVHGDPQHDELVVPGGPRTGWREFVRGKTTGQWEVKLSSPVIGAQEGNVGVFHTLDPQIKEAYVWAGGLFYTVEPRATFRVPPHGKVDFTNYLGAR